MSRLRAASYPINGTAHAPTSTCTPSAPSVLQTTALARAYAFLLECQQMSWAELEAKLCRPYKSACRGLLLLGRGVGDGRT